MKKSWLKILLIFLGIVFVFLPVVSRAEVDLGLDQANPGLGEATLPDIVKNIVQIFLGFLGLIAVILILYGGFTWMTAGGNQEKVVKGRRILINAVIGLVIILSAYAIAAFIINRANEAIGGTGDDGGGDGGGLNGTTANFIVRSWQPSDGSTDTARNIMVRVFFNKTIDSTSVSNGDISFTSPTGAVDFTITVANNRLDIQPLLTCDVAGVDYCLAADTNYNVSIAAGSVSAADGKNLVCTSGCQTSFTTGDYIDLTAPTVSIVSPTANSTYGVAGIVSIAATAEDDSGVVAALTFYADDTEVTPEGTDGAEPWEGIYQISGYDSGDTIAIAALAEDLSGNVGTSGDVDIRILPDYCFDGILDGDETDLDCGGSCGGCLGDSCDINENDSICTPSDYLCGQGVCSLDCICQLAPVISAVSPLDGAIGNYVTLTGDDFGTVAGRVVFLGSEATGDEVTASLADCAVAWLNDQVVVEVPAGAVSGGLKLITSDGSFDTTLDDRGWQGEFAVNEVVRPGICGLDPTAGQRLSEINIQGTQFGDAADAVLIGGVEVSGGNIHSWSDQAIVSVVPNLEVGRVSVVVRVADEYSNAVTFKVLADETVPVISYLEPTSGPIGTYVTIHGSGFGKVADDILVKFTAADGSEIPADVDFPETCGVVDISDSQILVKVPTGVSLGEWGVVVVKEQQESNSVDFTVDNSALLPGMCLLLPANGPVGTVVDVYGENFGSSQGDFTFYNNQTATIGAWSGAHIQTSVPTEAMTGSTWLTSANAVQSNSLNFMVGSCTVDSCSASSECCSDGICRALGTCDQAIGADEYVWSFTTGQQLPPFKVNEVWPQCEAACTNAVIGVAFTNPLDVDSITDSSVDVLPCNGEACTSFGTEINYQAEGVAVGYYDEENYILNIVPASLSLDQYYRVIIKTGVLGVVNTDGGYFENTNYTTASGQAAYSWIFKTGSETCSLDRVEVRPAEQTLIASNQKEGLVAYAYSAADDCSAVGQSLNSYDFTWNWSVADPSLVSVTATSLSGPLAEVSPLRDGSTLVRATTLGENGQALVTVDLDIPKIDYFYPDNGAIRSEIKTYVTIYGTNFGVEQGDGKVLVGNLEAKIGDCAGAWSDSQIVIELPLATVSGSKITVIKGDESDISDQSFTINNLIRPAICNLSPNYGTVDDKVTISGHNFGDTQVDSLVYFDQIAAAVVSWSNQKIVTQVPLGATTGPVYVKVLGNSSNTVNFSLEPYISYLSPEQGPVNTYVSIYGGNFGDVQGNGFVAIGGEEVSLAECAGSWSNSLIIVEVPESLDLGDQPVQVVTNYGVTTNKVDFKVNEDPLGPLLCELNPNWAATNETINLIGDNFQDSPSVNYTETVATKLGAGYSTISTSSCVVNNGSYVGACSNLWVDYNFSFPVSGYYLAWAETSNNGIDLTSQDIYHHVNVYLDGVLKGDFSNLATNPDHQIGQVELGLVTAGSHLVRYYWNNDWCGGCNGGTGDSNILFHQVGIDSGEVTGYPLFTKNVQTDFSAWSNNRVTTTISSAVQSGPAQLLREVVVGKKCAGFHIGSWCPGGEYENITKTVKSNSLNFVKGCVIATGSSRLENVAPTVAANSEAVGVVATDGQYLYGKSWSSYDQYDNIVSIIGSGHQGTVLGQDYGDLATVSSSITMTYYPDGYLYNGYSTTGYNLQRVNVASGVVDMNVNISAGLLNRNTGEVYAGVSTDNLITSDGRYVYNLAFGTKACPANYGSRCYDGFRVRVFDPLNNWSLVREWTSGTESFYTDGIIADGKYIYAIEWGGQHQIRMMDAVSGEVIEEWISEQGQGGSTGSGNDIISGQYDWVNDIVWLGDLVDWDRSPGPAYIYQYNSCNTYTVGGGDDDEATTATNPKVWQSFGCDDNIQSPSPYNSSEGICTSAAISVSFDQLIAVNTLTEENISIQACGQTDEFAEANCSSAVAFTADNITIFNPQADTTGFILYLNNNLAANTWYQVSLSADILGINDLGLVPYVWHFKTAAGECQLSRVAVAPSAASVMINSSQSYTALPYGENCEVLAADDFGYQWTSSNLGVAVLGSTTLSTNLATALAGGSSNISAAVGLVSGSSVLTVTVPPNCGDGILQIKEGEKCDDGNTAAGDGCSIYCQFEIVTGGYCGDSTIQWPNANWQYERCDDGNASAGDGCSNICYLENDTNGDNCLSCDSEISDSQLAWWKFDEGSGVVAADEISDFNSAALVNNVAWTIGKVGGSALTFTDSSQYAEVGEYNNNLTPASGLTLSTWLNSDEYYQEYSVASLKYGGDWPNISQLSSVVSGMDDYVNISEMTNYGYLTTVGSYYDTVAKIPIEIYDHDIIIWDHATIDLDASLLSRNKPVILMVKESRYNNYAGEEMWRATWPVSGYNNEWSSLTVKIKRSSVANNVLILSSGDPHSDVWCSWEHDPVTIGKHFGSLIGMLTGQIVTKGGAYGLFMDNDQVYGYINSSGTRVGLTSIVGATIQDGWNYVVLTYSGENLVLYLNGAVVDAVVYAQPVKSNLTDVLLGQFYSGALDEVKIYDGARTAAEIEQSYLDCTAQCVATDLDDEEDEETSCGDGVIDLGEECDLDNFADATCASFSGYNGGSLICNNDCTVDFSSCVAGTVTSDVCLNTEISAEFDALMDWSSFVGAIDLYEPAVKACAGGEDAGTTCSLNSDCDSSNCAVVMSMVSIPLTYSLENLPAINPAYTKLYLYPMIELDPNTTYEARVTGGIDGVRDVTGSILENDYTWQFITGEDYCTIATVKIDPKSYEFNNANETVNFTVHAYDNKGNLVSGNYTWAIEGSEELINYSPSSLDEQVLVVSPAGGGGELSLQATVEAGDYGSGTAQAPINIFLCNAPWSYENETYNFETKYCRGDDKNLLSNSGFEDDADQNNLPDLWRVESGSDWTLTQTEASSGDYSLLNASGSGVMAQEINNLVAGKTYTLSVKVRMDGLGTATLGVDDNSEKLTTDSIDDGLLGYWKLNEESLLAANLTVDSSPYDNDGAVYGAVLTTDQNGESNQAMSFDGYNDYIKVADSSNDLSVSGAISLVAWVKFNNSGSHGAIMSKGRALGINGDYGYSLSRYGGTNKIYFDTYSTNLRDALVSTTVFNNTNWHLIIATWDGTTNPGGKKLYVDGVLDGQKASIIATMGTPNYDFKIGDSSVTSHPFYGSIADVRVYNRALSSVEVAQLYNSGRSSSGDESSNFYSGSGWEDLAATFVASDSSVQVELAADSGGIYFDDAQLELGKTATDFAESDLLPSLKVVPASVTGNELLNVLFLQTDYGVADGIGLRVFSNFDHYSPSDWYDDNVDNPGVPTEISVGGYSALSEGRSTYVNAANLINNNVYTNLFVLSYTPEANSATKEIFDQLYDNWLFNSNIDSYNERQRLVNDARRWEDAYNIRQALTDYYQEQSDYPSLASGSYITGKTVSVWDSWQNSLGSTLGVTLPVDPINTQVDCAADYDPVTCWSPVIRDYQCLPGSHVYQYEYVDGEYYLYGNFELDGVTWRSADSGQYIGVSDSCLNVIFSNED